MKNLSKILLISFLTIFLAAGSAMALELGTDITIWDKSGVSYEDGEVEPNCIWNQIWDLEGFFLNDYTLTMVGGYDFANGEGGYDPGDIFIDVDGDVEYGPGIGPDGGTDLVSNSYFHYDYVLDLTISSSDVSYTVYQIDDDSTLRTIWYNQNEESNPWEYVSGATGTIGTFTGDYHAGLSSADVDGLAGASHNAVVIDLSFLGEGTDFTAHYTYECGNDNLMGSGTTPIPEPASMLLLGTGLIGMAGIGRKKFANKS